MNHCRQKQIIQLFGPTGVGKSRVAIELAHRFDCEIISADSMQVYRDFNIGTDKILPEEMSGIPHHMLDIISDCSQFNASIFLEKAFAISENIIEKGKIPLICGGTPLYHRVISRGIFPEKDKSPEIREELKKRVEQEGLQILWEELYRLDPLYAEKIGPNDQVRIIRAFEIYQVNQVIPSDIFKHTKTPFEAYRFLTIGLNIERKALYKRIENRVDEMIRKGLVDEVISLRKQYRPDCPPFASLGYKEISMVLDQQIDLTEGIELIKQHSRNYAKRQLSWFRQEKDVHWFSPENLDQIIKFVDRRLASIV